MALRKLMTRTARPWDKALYHAQAGMSVEAELVTMCPVEGKDEGTWRIIWRVRDNAHIEQVDQAISETYGDDEDDF